MEFDITYFMDQSYLDKIEVELDKAIRFKFPNIAGLKVDARFGIVTFEGTQDTEIEVRDFIFQLQKNGLGK